MSAKENKNQDKQTCDIEIKNELGLHARPAALFVKVANGFASEIILEKEGEQINGKSIMGVMMLAASKGSKVRLLVEGKDAKQAMESLKKLFEDKFGEDG